MSLGDVYTISDVGHVNADDPLVNVFHVRDVDGLGTITDLLTQWEAHGWLSQVRGVTSTDCHFDVVNARLLIPYGTGTIFVNHTTFTGGASANPVVALNSAAVVTWYTGLIGRTHRGRTFEWGLPSSANLKGQWDPVAFGFWTPLLVNFFNYWKSGGTSVHYELGVWSRKVAGHTPPFNPLAFVPITLFTARPFFRSQRRRNFGISIGRGA